MKTLVIGNEDRYRKYMPADIPFVRQTELIFCPRGSSDEELLAAARDADYIAADPMTQVSGTVIRSMPNLKMIHSEGVGFNGFDLAAARERGIYVCNCKGVNAGAVAEQTILLILALLRNAVVGDRVEREGGQIRMKERMMFEGIREVSDCTVGLVGFGDIAKATAERLIPFGCNLVYTASHKKDAETEQRYHVTYLPLSELIAQSDIVSLHVPVTDETRGMVNAEFLGRMKKDAFLINTARGDLVDNQALRQALIDGTIQGAGLDTIYPEPTLADNPLVDLPAQCADRVIYSPHIGGITTSSFRRSHRMIWQGFADCESGKRPHNIVNGL